MTSAVKVNPDDLRRLHGMHMKLARKQDKKEPCCSNLAIVHVIESVPELWCADCGHPRGELPIEAANWILTVISFWPEAIKDVHTYTDEALVFAYRAAETGKGYARDTRRGSRG